MKLIKSKKAIGVDDLFPLLFIIIAFVIIILLFTYTHSKDEKEINKDLTKITREMTSYDLLQKFLSTEVYVNLNQGNINLPQVLKKMTMAELINLYYHNNEYEADLIRESKLILETFPTTSTFSGWNLNIYLMPHEYLVREINTYPTEGGGARKISYASTPLSSNSGEYLKIRLYEAFTLKDYTPKWGTKF